MNFEVALPAEPHDILHAIPPPVDVMLMDVPNRFRTCAVEALTALPH